MVVGVVWGNSLVIQMIFLLHIILKFTRLGRYEHDELFDARTSQSRSSVKALTDQQKQGLRNGLKKKLDSFLDEGSQAQQKAPTEKCHELMVEEGQQESNTLPLPLPPPLLPHQQFHSIELLEQQIFTAAQQGSERLLSEFIEQLQSQLRLQIHPSVQAVESTIKVAVENSLNVRGEATFGDMYTTTVTQCTPLVIAIIKNHTSCVKVLLLHLHQSSSVNKPDVRFGFDFKDALRLPTQMHHVHYL